MDRWPGWSSVFVANASIWCASVMQGVGPAADQDIPLTVRKPLDRVISETSLTLCQLSQKVLHICCPATHSEYVHTHSRVFQSCGFIYQACPWATDLFCPAKLLLLTCFICMKPNYVWILDDKLVHSCRISRHWAYQSALAVRVQ